MAQFGAKRPRWAPVASQPEAALPTYTETDIVTLGKLVKADLSVTNASGELYADDSLAERVDMFASGSLALETDDMTDEKAAAIYGASIDAETEETTYKDSDNAPYGGVAYYKVLMRNGVKIYKGVFLPLVKAALGNDNAATKGNSITFGTTATAFTVFRCNSGAWRLTKEFTGASAEADCIAWCDSKLGGAEQAATPTANPVAGAVASGESVTLSSATPGAEIYYTLNGYPPTQGSTPYENPIEITEHVTIKAKAYAEGYAASEVMTAAYTITL